MCIITATAIKHLTLNVYVDNYIREGKPVLINAKAPQNRPVILFLAVSKYVHEINHNSRYCDAT